MSPIRVIASVLSLLNGALAVYMHYYGAPFACTLCTAPSPGTVWLAVAGGVLVVGSLVSLVGVRASFAVDTALCALIVMLFAVQWGSYDISAAPWVVALSAICIVLNALAFRPARGLSEKDSPLNLPVFG